MEFKDGSIYRYFLPGDAVDTQKLEVCMSQFFYIHPDNPQARLISQSVEILNKKAE